MIQSGGSAPILIARRLLLAAVFGVCAGGVFAKAPNVVVIVSDDAAYSDFGFSAALNNIPTQIETPNLDALAQQSVVGAQYYTSHSLCAPSRAGFLTGLYPQRFGFEENLRLPQDAPGLSANEITIAQRLKPLGYTTGMIGKWHQGFTEGVNRPNDKGFDEFYGLLGGGRNYFSHYSFENAIFKNNQFYENQYAVEGDHSRYDPVNGRYVTDAFGEEAASFINRHASDENPFFLYVAHIGPHEPLQAKQSDLDHFANIADPTRRAIAAMTYAVDRAVGDVLGALQNNGIDDDTIVVFTNDNGAVSYIGNPPFRGHKGTSYEGGIRVPFLIKAPGLQPGVYDSPVTGLDLLPTIVTAAGGDISQFAHDGYDVLPFLKGEASDDPNKAHFWRNFSTYAVRKGDWKLTIANQGATQRWLHNIEQSPNENVFLQGGFFSIQADLLRELTNWEAQLEKPKWGPLGVLNQNTFDHFVFRNDLAATTNWSTASAWRQGGTANNKTMMPADAYANGVFEFGVRNDANYTATNDMKRMSRETFMLNQLRLTGNFSGAANRQGTINGNAVLFVKSLNGDLPQIRLDATSSDTPAGFIFQVGNELQLLHDLEITGNGTQQFVISGRIRDYYEPLAPTDPTITVPHNVIKNGSSRVTLTADNSFAGKLTIDAGSVVVSGPSAAISGASRIDIHNGGNLTLSAGTIKVPVLDIAAGGSFTFNGGTLKAVNVVGNLTNSGGTFAPGASAALSTVSGNFVQSFAGTLQIELAGATPGSQFDRLVIDGLATLGGQLQVQLANGFVPSLSQSFEILTANNINSLFSQYSLPTLPGGLGWQVRYTTRSVTLAVQTAAGLQAIVPIGDYNRDGDVDAADYSVWRDSMGSTTQLAADGNGDHVVDQADYAIWKSYFGTSFATLAGDFNLDGAVDAVDYTVWRDGLGTRYTINDYTIWKANFGNTRGGAGGAAFSNSVPEPTSMLLAALGAWFCSLIVGLPRRPWWAL